MKYLIGLLLLACLCSCHPSTAEPSSDAIHDSLQAGPKEEDSVTPQETEQAYDTKYGPYIHRTFRLEAYHQLIGLADGKEILLIDTTDERIVYPDTALDFDGNGLLDLLVWDNVTGGGNCCPVPFFFVSQPTPGKFVVTESMGDSWSSPEPEFRQGRWTARIIANNEGFNTYPYEEVTEWYGLEKDRMVLVEKRERHELRALKEIRSSDPDFMEGLQLRFDFDDNGLEDRLDALPWERWGRLIPTLTMDDGRQFDLKEIRSKRIGLLSSTTNGMHDLLGDLDDVFVWTGQGYVLKEK